MLNEFWGLQAALKRSAELEKLNREQAYAEGRFQTRKYDDSVAQN